MSRAIRGVHSFLKYCFVAGGSAACDWGVFIALMFFGVPSIAAHMTSRICGGVFSFTFNKMWSFDSHKSPHLTQEGRRFLLLYAISYFLSTFLLIFGLKILLLSPWWAKLMADVSCFVINFAVMQLYVFSGKKGLVNIAMKTLQLFRQTN